MRLLQNSHAGQGYSRVQRFHNAALTKNQNAELASAHFRGTYDDDIGGQALLVLGTLAERAE